jgi:hypothetical protein
MRFASPTTVAPLSLADLIGLEIVLARVKHNCNHEIASKRPPTYRAHAFWFTLS